VTLLEVEVRLVVIPHIRSTGHVDHQPLQQTTTIGLDCRGRVGVDHAEGVEVSPRPPLLPIETSGRVLRTMEVNTESGLCEMTMTVVLDGEAVRRWRGDDIGNDVMLSEGVDRHGWRRGKGKRLKRTTAERRSGDGK
jgi:hypothetical protein